MTLPDLSELQRDALLEIFNIGVGQAAHNMSQIVADAVSLSVPMVEILPGHNQADAISSIVHSPRICAVSQDFTGCMNTTALLIFPEGKTREIVRRMIGDTASAGDLSEMEQEALSEIGNIILNSCFSSFADLLNSDFQSSLPVYHLGSIEEVLSAQTQQDNNLLLLLHIDFSLPSDQINGYLVFLLTMPSFHALIERIDQFLSGIHGR